MAGVLTLQAVDVSRRKIRRTYRFVPSATAGQGYTTGGETLNFLTAGNPNGEPRRTPPPSPLPNDNNIKIVKNPGGYDCDILQNTVSPTLANYVLKFFTSGGTELTQADYPAGLAGKNVEFEIVTATKNG